MQIAFIGVLYCATWAAALGGTGPPQTFRHLTLCLWAVHGKNQLQIVLVPPPNRDGVAPPLLCHFSSTSDISQTWMKCFWIGHWMVKAVIKAPPFKT